MKSHPHNKEGHLNIFILDQDNFVTGYGKHARGVAFIPDSEGLYCRVDYVWGLPEPTEKQILKVANHYGDAKGRWQLKNRVKYYSHGNKCECEDFIFEK